MEMLRIFSLPDLKEIFENIMKEPVEILKKRMALRPISEREKLREMVHCKNCHACAIRTMILKAHGKPEKICEYCMVGICLLEESQWEHTLEEVGQVMGVTRERVRQIELKAIRKLRHPKKSARLRPFYESSLERERKDDSAPYQL